MFRNFFKRNRSLQPPLGRWRIGQNQDVVNEKVRRSNEDHCGSSLCQGAFIKDGNNNEDKNKKVNAVKTIIVINFDPLLPFCI